MFQNSHAALVIAALSLSACGTAQPIVTTGDITKHLEGLGYTKVLIQDSISCGKMGNGRRFIATKTKVVFGQVCYRKENGSVTYKVDELTGKAPTKASSKPANDNKIDGGASFWNKS